MSIKLVCFNIDGKKVYFNYDFFTKEYGEYLSKIDKTSLNEGIKEANSIFESDTYELFDYIVGNITKEIIKDNALLEDSKDANEVDIYSGIMNAEFSNFEVLTVNELSDLNIENI